MGRKFYLQLLLLSFVTFAASAQTGEIKGKIIEKGGKEIPFASIAALVNGTQVLATSADFDGNYTLKPLSPGKYDVKATAVGFQPVLKTNVIVTVDNISFVDMELGKGVEIKEIEVVDYAVPLIDKGSPSQKKTLTFDEIQSLPTRDVNSAAVQSAGVYQKEAGGELNIRGSRSDATSYYVDGIKVNGSPGVSQRGTEQITVITGGIPAQYGDATGGIITVTTRGPSNSFGGGLELATSENLDAFGYNLISGTLTGPIYKEKDENGKKTGQSIAGFFLAGEYQYDKDPSPSVIPIYRVKQSILDDVLQNPITAAPGGGYIHRSSFFTFDSLETQKYRENVAQNAFRVNGKIDIRPVKNFTVTLGGSLERTKSNEYSRIYSLMNFDNNAERTATKWRAFAKITQRFGNENTEKASSAIKNAYYSIQVDYSNSDEISQSARHKKNAFNYGYVGKFKTYSVPFYALSASVDSLGNVDSLLAIQTNNFDTLYDFTPGTLNPYTTNYTQQYYNLTDPLGTQGYQDNQNNVLTNGGLINGDNRTALNVYGLWATTGRNPNGFSFNNTSQGRITASGSADIKNHNIVVGLEFEKRTVKGYNLLASSLWSRMRELANQQLKLNGIDSTSGTSIYFTDPNGLVYGQTTYSKGKYTPFRNKENEVTRGFYENIRDRLGVDYRDTVQTDSFSPDELSPTNSSQDLFSLDLFTPDELFNNGNSIVSYYGYDYKGNEETSSSWNLKDFFVDKDENNNNIRKIDAYRPIYMAGYIQDRFTFNDIIFNVGVRVDRFDANQKVLKDPYSLYETFKAGDAQVTSLPGTEVPSNIGKDYVVYVNNFQASPPEVLGYRNEDVWYDRFGNTITDLSSLTPNGTIQPYLKNSDDYLKTRVNPNGFADYEPQVNVMPRVAFSFPISDEAYFAAHYDVLTQRPQSSAYSRFNPIDYLTWSQGITGDFSNPNLKPEKTTVYEINFQQKLSRSSAFSITAFYKEMKNNIQQISLEYAFPIKYTTYGNVDFGTVKGLTFSYDLRRTSNIRLNFSYTLQFADGTGSDEASSSGILSQAGQTNLREVKPLSFDQRHTLVAAIDFHYGEGKDYNGPVWFNKQVFANAGMNIVLQTGSGAPYTRKSNITPEADFTTTENSRSVITGSLNGSRYPWNYKIDTKFDKDFSFNNGVRKDGKQRKPISMNVYLQILNVLNTKNVTTVYKATGNASDDGYITSPGAKSKIEGQPSPQAYTDLYKAKVDNPQHYDIPRRIHLGVQINF